MEKTLTEKEYEDLRFFREQVDKDLELLTRLKTIEDPELQLNAIALYYAEQYFAVMSVRR